MSRTRSRTPLRYRVRIRVVARTLLIAVLIGFATALYSTATRPPQDQSLSIVVAGEFGSPGSFAGQVWDGASAAAKALNAELGPTLPRVVLTQVDLGAGTQVDRQKMLISHLATHPADLIIDAGLSDASADIASVCHDLSLPRLICVATSIDATTPRSSAAIRLLPNNASQASAIVDAIGNSPALLIAHRSRYGDSLREAISTSLSTPPRVIEYGTDVTPIWCALDAIAPNAVPPVIVVIGYKEHLVTIMTALEVSKLPSGRTIILTDGFFDDGLEKTIRQGNRHSYSIAFPATSQTANLTKITDGFTGFGHDAVLLAFRASRLTETRPKSLFLQEIAATPKSLAIPTNRLGRLGLINSYAFTRDYENTGTQFHIVPIISAPSQP